MRSLLALLALSPALAGDGPVKVYVLAGQSNMVGIGQVTSGGTRWGAEFLDPVVSVYQGAHDPDADYDALTPTTTLALEAFGGVRPTPYPQGGTCVVRGRLRMKAGGLYRFNPGYGGSTHNVMHVNEVEVHRRPVGGDPVHQDVRLEAGEEVPFRVTYLTSQANGLGWWSRMDVPGTLATLVRDGKFPHLVDEGGAWVTRDDVWYKGVVTATADKPLGVGCGAGGHQIGPELGFGHVIGDHHDAPVLLLKASQGNRSLGWDFLPPGSARFEEDGWVYAGYGETPSRWEVGTEPEPINWYAGKQYDDCFGEAKRVLANFDQEFPHWAGRGYELAGFVWWQGHKDGGEPHASRYEQNLVRLIHALRDEFQAPRAPFVIATIGFGGWEMSGPHLKVAEAQLAVGSGKYPELVGSVATVETRDFWRMPEASPRDQGFHYNQNAETYYLVGEALGRGMVALLESLGSR